MTRTCEVTRLQQLSHMISRDQVETKLTNQCNHNLYLYLYRIPSIDRRLSYSHNSSVSDTMRLSTMNTPQHHGHDLDFVSVVALDLDFASV